MEVQHDWQPFFALSGPCLAFKGNLRQLQQLVVWAHPQQE